MVKNSPAITGEVKDLGLIPGSGKFPGGGRGNHSPTKYTCLENFVDRGAWQSTVHGIANGQTGQKRLSTF